MPLLTLGVGCCTDLGTCCRSSDGIHCGDWIPPGSEENLPPLSNTSANIYQIQGAQRINLCHRNNASTLSAWYVSL